MMKTTFWKILDKGFMNLMERSWKHEVFWKWYYRIVIIGVVIGYAIFLFEGITEEL